MRVSFFRSQNQNSPGLHHLGGILYLGVHYLSGVFSFPMFLADLAPAYRGSGLKIFKDRGHTRAMRRPKRQEQLSRGGPEAKPALGRRLGRLGASEGYVRNCCEGWGGGRKVF